MKKIKVLFIAGTGRNGSTLLANILGQTDNCINIGEALSFLLNYSRRKRDLPCSCGKSMNECVFWSKNKFLNPSNKLIKKGTELISMRTMLKLLNPFYKKNKTLDLELVKEYYLNFLKDFQNENDFEYIIESSKHPMVAKLLSEIEQIDLTVIHLVRHPYGLLESWQKKNKYLNKRNSLNIIIQWISYNLFIRFNNSHFDKYLYLEYEKFVKNPKMYLKNIDSISYDKNFLKNNILKYYDHHSLAGNPMKLKKNDQKIFFKKPKIRLYEKIYCSLLTYPFNIILKTLNINK